MMKKDLKILVTGGAGYIGSHIINMLLSSGDFSVVSIDKNTSLNQKYNKKCIFIKGDIGNKNIVKKVLIKYKINIVLHLAALISVEESMKSPALYFQNNITAAVNLLEAMKETKVNKIIFSSSTAVYGFSSKKLIGEESETSPSSIYGLTKISFENILRYYNQNYNFSSISLRIFNAAGADPRGELKELHNPETHIIPKTIKNIFLNKPAVIYGKDYKTQDGSCIRDYIHVNDISKAFLLAIPKTQNKICETFNLGSGKGRSVKEVVEECYFLLKKDSKVIFKERRSGDPAILVSNNDRIKKFLKWRPKYNLEDIILHTIKSQV